MSYGGADIIFPNLGIVIENIRNHITVFGFDIAFYGIIIGAGFLLAMLLIDRVAKATGQNPDLYWDFFVYVIIFGIIGARAYYVIFNWEYYAQNPMKIFNTREGGLAIYGGIITVILVLVIYAKRHGQSFALMIDTIVPGLLLGQSIGRWGNFFNCECFGRYTEGLFAMRIRRELVNASMIDEDLLSHLIVDEGIEYIQVHPTFLYESLWNFATLIFVLWYGKNKKRFDGEIILLYMICYGIGRFWIEGLRTDSLMIPGTGLRVSQCVALVSAVAGVILFIILQRKNRTQQVPE